jgi:CRISPR-associated exonuclease Cas4
MFFLIAFIAAALAWFVGRGLFARTGLPTRDILYADVGSTFPQQAPLTSRRYRLSGRPDYLVRVKDGVAPVELKSSRSPSSGRPYDGHLFQLAAYCLLVEDVCRVSVPYGLVRYEDRTIRVEYTPSLRAGCLRFLTKSGWPNAAGNATSTTINLANAGLAGSVLIAERV